MQRNTKYAGVILSAITILSFGLTPAAYSQVSGSVTINSTCGLTFPGGSTIAYGSIDADAESSEITLTVRNSGSVVSSIEVQGEEWVSGSTVHIDGELTKFANSTRASTDYATEKQRLNNTNVELIDFGRIQPATTNSTYWQVLATLQNTPFSGALTQTITFTVTCI